jgi:hypothetical protein
VSAQQVVLCSLESNCRITPLSNIGKDAPRISGKNFHGHASTFWLSHVLKKVSNPKGSFVWKDSYVFLIDLDGKMLAHPFQPELTKQEHVLLITDPTDKALFVHFVNLARKVGNGWVEYMWPKPGKTRPSQKLTYIYRVPNQDLFVGPVYVGRMIY